MVLWVLIVINESSVFGGYGHLRGVAGFHVAYDLCVDVEASGYVDDALCGGFVGVDFHAVSHVEYFVHLFPFGCAFVVNHAEEWRDGEEVVFNHVEFVDEVQHFGLGAAAAVYHAADVCAVLVEYAPDDRGVGAGGGEDHFACIHSGYFGGVGESPRAAVDYVLWQVVVVAHGVLRGIEFGKDVVACRGEAVAAHAAVVLCFVGGLAVGGKAYDDVAGVNVRVVDDIGAAHTCGDGRVGNDGANKVAHVGGFAPCEVDAYAEVAHLLQELFGAVNDGADYFAGDEVFVAADGGGEQDVVDGAYAEEVVEVHDYGVDGYAFPNAHVAGFFPIKVGQRRFGAGPVGVHDVAVVFIASQIVGYYFAECFREEAFVDVLDGVVDVFFGG